MSHQSRLGLVLSGGGARGAFQVGVWKHLQNHATFKDKPLVISGTSAGSLNGAFIAAGKTTDEMMDFWMSLTENPPVHVSHRFFASGLETIFETLVNEPLWLLTNGLRDFGALVTRLRNHFPFGWGSSAAMIVEHLLATRFDIVSRFLDSIKESHLANISGMRQRLVEFLGSETVPESEHRLAINTVDANTGQIVRFINYKPETSISSDYQYVESITVDMIMASAAIPILFNPIKVGDRLLWDGGVLVNTPLAAAVSLGADSIYTILVTRGPSNQSHEINTLGAAVERLADAFLENAYNLDRKLCLERNRLADMKGSNYRKVKLYQEIRPTNDEIFSAGSYLYFQKPMLQKMYLHGEIAVKSWLKNSNHEDSLMS